MHQYLKNSLYVIRELGGDDDGWFVGLFWVVPIFTAMTIIGLIHPPASLDFMGIGANLLPLHYIVIYLMIVPVKYLIKTLIGTYDKLSSKEDEKRVVFSFTGEMIGYVLAVMFALLATLTPAITDSNFSWFVIFGGFLIPPCYNILSKYHLGQSVIVNYFTSFGHKDNSLGAPFK